MRQDEGDGAGVEMIVQRIQNRPCHWHAVMRLEQCRYVWRHDGDGVPRVDAAAAQRLGEPPTAVVELAIGEPGGAMNNRELVGIDRGGARQESKWCQRGKVCRVASEVRRIVRTRLFALVCIHQGCALRVTTRDRG